VLNYDVDVSLRLKASELVGALGDVATRAASIDEHLRWLELRSASWGAATRAAAGSVLDTLGAVAMTAGKLALPVALSGIGLAAGAAAYGVGQLNAQLESSTISLGTIYYAKGAVGSIAEGVATATESIKLMRKEAALLPGEFEDLQKIVVTTATPLLATGMSPTDQIKLSSKIMAAGVVTQMPLDQVAREAALLVEGRAGGANMFGVKLLGLQGDAATRFNQKPVQDRIATITRELDKYAGAIDVFSTSWTAVSSTFMDTLKTVGGQATAPLFELIKHQLGNVNTWLEQNQEKVSKWADEFGYHLFRAWQKASDWVEINGPRLLETASKFADILRNISIPVLETILENPGTTIASLIAAKAGMAAATNVAGRAVGTVLGGGAAASAGAASVGLLPAAEGAGAVAAGSAGVAVGLLPAAEGAGAVAAGSAGVAVGLPALAALAVLAPAVWALNSAYEAHHDVAQKSALVDAARSELADSGNAKLREQLTAFDDFKDRIESASSMYDSTGTGVVAFSDATVLATQSLNEMSATLFALGTDSIRERVDADISDFADRAFSAFSLAGAAITQADKAQKQQKKGIKSEAGTTIQKVEIVVTSNNEPTRVARLVRDELVRVGRSYGTSTYARNPSAVRPF